MIRKHLEIPHQSPNVAGEVVVGLKEQGAIFTQSGRGTERQKGRWGVPAV